VAWAVFKTQAKGRFKVADFLPRFGSETKERMSADQVQKVMNQYATAVNRAKNHNRQFKHKAHAKRQAV
jgi:hypothetical protein